MLVNIFPPEKELTIAGMMSGTSFDGIDVAIVRVKGVFTSLKYRVLELCFHPYPDSVKLKIEEFLKEQDIELLSELDVDIALEHVKALKRCRHLPEVDLISMHGQTLWHSPRKKSVQIGNADIVTIQIGKIVISDFRSKDIAVGGEGAPITPYIDYCVFSKSKTTALNNIGGISNLTIVGKSPEDVLAFDTGPGNALIDIVAREKFGIDYDKDGKIALSGKVHEDIAQKVLESDEYIWRKPPKSTGKEYYNSDFLKRFGIDDPNDLIATVTYYTALTMRKSYEMYVLSKFSAERVYLSGGGARNSTLLKFIEKELSEIGIRTFVFSKKFSDFKEAIWFALLGNEFAKGHFSNLPSVTGAKKRVSLGKISVPW